MIRIAITVEAFEGDVWIAPLGSVGYENATNARGERLIWLGTGGCRPLCAPCAARARAIAMSFCG